MARRAVGRGNPSHLDADREAGLRCGRELLSRNTRGTLTELYSSWAQARKLSNETDQVDRKKYRIVYSLVNECSRDGDLKLRELSQYPECVRGRKASKPAAG